ncbi:MAG: porin [Rubrivivax sp.]|nr:MAG: porin [Rubrivivax sp.]
MQKTILTKAVAVALATLGAGAAMAQSSVTLYGHADISVDNVNKTAGVPALPGAGAGQGTKANLTRVSPSGTSQTSFGLKGTEDLGSGWAATFVLEGQLGHDTGALGQDGRIFGRQSYVGLTTPYGEVRLGRQYAPIFYSTAFVTGERFGATDLFTEGGASNNLQVRQDNQVSYWAKFGGFTGSIAYSPNAGSLPFISAARGGAANNAGAPGGMLGSAGSGTEGNNRLGRSVGAFGNMAFTDAFNMTLGYHHNDFDGARFGALNPATGNSYLSQSTFVLDKYQAGNIGAKYVMPGSGLMFDGAFGQGEYSFSNSGDLTVQFAVVGTRIPVGQWTLSAQVSQIRFKNFTKGKDTGMMLGAEYGLSKRTTLYVRAAQIKDDEGTAASAGLATVGNTVVGGPDVISTSFGFRETPVFAGANLNPGGRTTYVGAGVRHSF